MTSLEQPVIFYKRDRLFFYTYEEILLLVT